ncbi:MAG TPA: (d)CMP kinase [Micromonosporaceae bacterium]|nr:(d)CMP kinase [Micromonosporaceae bacterium]
MDADVRCVVAIDGPSGTGKSTVSRRLAIALGARYLDTGAMYRAVTWAVLDAGVDPSDAVSVAEITAKITLDSGTDPREPHISVDGRAVDVEIRGPDVTGAVSAVAAIRDVRSALVARQQEIIAGNPSIVVEGRDIAAVVAPDADLKVYLTASAAERARRRSSEFNGGVAASDAAFTATQADLARRDRLDSTRVADPLRRAADAIEVDTTGLDVDAVVDILLDLLKEKASR